MAREYDDHCKPRRPTRRLVTDPLAGVGTIGMIEEVEAMPEPPPSERQMIYVRDLCNERGLPVPVLKSRREASAAIEKLKTTPRFPQGVTITHVEVEDDKEAHYYYALELSTDGHDLLIPVGKYAIKNAPTNTVNDISFWSVWVNDDGKIWRLKQVVGGILENVPHASILPILKVIGRDPEAAMALYGHEIGQCGACGRQLTNKLSRRLGIGPICRQMRGWS